MSSQYERLHVDVRRRLNEMRWQALRPIQDAAIDHLMSGRGDCVIAAPTAGGKTEAAFLPILSMVADDWSDGVRAMYVGPLKALINDQFRRMGELCERMELPVHRWHGDVGDTQRKALLSRPSGVLLITPESLEAMFVLRPTQMPDIFKKLAFIVIDEMHSFIGSVRGAQLQSQLFRLAQRCSVSPVRVGLSATLGDPAAACRWIRPGSENPATYIANNDAVRAVKMRVRGIWKAPAPAFVNEQNAELQDESMCEIARAIVRSSHRTTNLVFANRKSRIEELADQMKTEAAAMGLRHDVLVHHGSLSKDQREAVEERLRLNSPCTAVCSNTLEMGIDIGQVDSVIQVDPPWSVASLTQRVGRSGRRGDQSAILRAFFLAEKPDAAATLWDSLHLNVLRGVAMTELMVDRFVETPDIARAHLSTLIHQLLCTLAETGGMPADRLFRRLMDSGAFGNPTPAGFASLLREMAKHELVAQMAEGDIIMGTLGERFRDHYSFYAAFVASEEFRVVHGNEEIGSISPSLLPPVGEHLLLAGRRWRVETVDGERKEVEVSPAKARRVPMFVSMGSYDIHPRVHQCMFELAGSTVVPTYLDDTAVEILRQLREAVRLAGNISPSIVQVPGTSIARLFLWAGSKVQRTIFLLVKDAGFEVEDEGVGLDVKASVGEVIAVLRNFLEGAILAEDVVLRSPEKQHAKEISGEKFDRWLPDGLWCPAYVRDRLDVDGAKAWIRLALASV